MRTHTPGPWRACTEKGDIPQTLYGGIIALLMTSDEPDGYVAVIRANGDRADGWAPTEALVHETMISNAYLIAAAPAMRDALRKLAINPAGTPDSDLCWCVDNGDERGDQHTNECLIARVALAAASPPAQPAPAADGGG